MSCKVYSTVSGHIYPTNFKSEAYFLVLGNVFRQNNSKLTDYSILYLKM